MKLRSFIAAPGLAAALALSLLDVRSASPQSGTAPSFSPAEIRRISAMGPWPPPPIRDPSNRLSGNAAAIALGEKLFFDPRLSSDSSMSCASCHDPQQGWADGKPRALGRRTLDRNTPSLWNVGLQRWFGWDGANDSLWAQSLRPILEPAELASSEAHVARLIRGDPDLVCSWRKAVGVDAETQSDQTVLVGVGKALASFQETLVTAQTPFDDFREALLGGNAAGTQRYPAAARRGLAIFVGKGNCTACHFGPTFSNGEFSDTGIPFFLEGANVDRARYGGIARLKASPFNLLGIFNDDPARSTAIGTRHVEQRHSNWGEFKVPPLRNVARSAPYGHNGSLATLDDVVRHYSALDEDRLHADGERILRRLDLTHAQSTDLVAFLRSLSDDRIWQRTPQEPCR